jgi:glycosyltransferase involved in cell wall biosynthesis
MTQFATPENSAPFDASCRAALSADRPEKQPRGRDADPSQPRRVLFVQTQAENAGAQEVARQLAQGASRNGWRTGQVFFFRRTGSFDGEDNVFFCARRRPSSPLGLMKLLIALYRHFRREAPDAVVAFQHYGNLIAAPIARLAGVKVVIANQVTAPGHVPAWARATDLWLGRLGFYDRVVVNSSETEAVYGAYPAPYARRLVRIDHGFFDKSLAMTKAEARRALDLPPDAELIGGAARLHGGKQLDLAIRLLTINRDQHLVLAGQGPDRARLEALANELGVGGRVNFLGELDTKTMGVFLAALDAFVHPSAGESFGLAPVEAAQAGVPVVVNDLPVLRDVLSVEGAPCALFVDARDTEAFAAATRRACEDKDLAAEFSARGRRLSQKFPLDRMVDEFMQLLQAAEPRPCR